jgi:hypothetical protein
MEIGLKSTAEMTDESERQIEQRLAALKRRINQLQGKVLAAQLTLAQERLRRASEAEGER